MAARDSRDKKGVERFVPPEEQQEKGKHAVFEVNPNPKKFLNEESLFLACAWEVLALILKSS